MENSVVEMSKALTDYMTNKKPQGSVETASQPQLKFGYIWQHLDQLFQQMTHDQVNELNRKFVNMAFEKLDEQKL